ncbi:HAD family phosphatase [Fluoribacter gormanii]|uniref:Beta-phosphoglucomutase n=1 Tax=Fluoribacter gormanii TaxID=464 RepID=A0A377GGT1_9GAMM|nr:HAD family phosphatase [Fluoribacter gormanii]KTD02255.1 HAD-superfamily hydrolase [Fluoribacter gormanii]MCW8444443.1 HAD family phosphatase [Fluoribacter gormanii]MCW8469636.1 HAD family phosphatase [Fluoribacter gormanii]SIR26625.1 beta-phosphoglucomutase [Fluoribacter gormanii]STO24037.1 Phosphorylated carbohydrates phosphatase TM_1254 [Fluoribacter gormanii]
MYDAIIFDFDGVILDSEPIHYEACCHVLKPLGISISYSDYTEKYLGLSDKDMFPKLLDNEGFSSSVAETKRLIQQKTEAYINIINTRDPLPLIVDFEQFIFKIAPKVNKIAICSGSSRGEITAVLSRVRQGKLRAYFDAIVTTEDVQSGKPSPEGYLLTAKLLNVTPGRCLVIEDTLHGIKAAKAAGMQVIGLTTTYDRHQFLIADQAITGYRQLLGRVW